MKRLMLLAQLLFVAILHGQETITFRGDESRLYRTRPGGERVDTLPIIKGDRFFAVHSVKTGPIATGDVLQVTADMEVTNDCGYNVGLGSFMVLAPTDSGVTRSPETTIAFAAVFNVTPDMHHGLVTRVGTLVASQDYPTGAYVNFVAYAQSSLLTCAGLHVERGYGQMFVTHFRK